MKERNSSISTREAAELTGFSARHIQNMIKKGKLSATRDEAGNYTIDKSEFYRVFPQTHESNSQPNTNENSSRTVLESQIEHLNEMIKEKNRQNEFLQKQLESANNEKSMLLETLTSNQKLLMHSTKSKRKKFLGLF